MRTTRLLGVTALALAIAGCGRPRAPRTEGDYTAVRVVRALPTQARIQAEDVALVQVPEGALPAHETRPRTVEEVLDASSLRPLPAGLVLQDGHLDLETLAPRAGAASLHPGERGLVAPVKGMGRDVDAGACLELAGVDRPLRLAACSPPGPELRSALLAGPDDEVLELARPGLAFPLVLTRVLPECPPPPPKVPPPAGTWREPVVVAARAVARGQVLAPDDIRVTKVPAELTPLGTIASLDAARGRQALHPLVPGQPITAGELTEPGHTGDETKLYVPGLHPDWVHPGGLVEYLRAGQVGEPTSLVVLDVERSLSDAPTPIRVRPLPGVTWPRSERDLDRPHQRGESDQLRWVLLLRR